jgi:hypothetical protein
MDVLNDIELQSVEIGVAGVREEGSICGHRAWVDGW